MADTLVTFDGGTPGADLVAGANGIESTPDAIIPKYIVGLHGAAAVQTGGPSNTTDSRFRVSTGVGANHYGSVYMKYNTDHASSGNFVVFLSWVNSGNSIMASLRVGSSRELNIRVGSSTIVRTGAANDVPLNSWFRFDWQVTGTTINWRMFYTPEADGASTPELSGTFTFTSATITKLVLGGNASQAITKDWSYDTVRATDTGSWFSAYTVPSTIVYPRKNWVGRPAAKVIGVATNQLGWGVYNGYGTGGAGSTTLPTTGGPLTAVPTFLRMTWTTAATSVAGIGFYNSIIATPYVVTAGDTYTISAYVRASAAGKSISIGAYFYTSAHVVIGVSMTSAPVVMLANTWQRISYTVKVPEGAGQMGIRILYTAGTTVVGETLDGSALLVEKSSALGAYFDGATAGGGTYIHTWDGTAHDSPSNEYLGPIANVWNGTAELLGAITVWDGATEIPASVGSIV